MDALLKEARVQQAQLQRALAERQTLETQLQESVIVEKEFSELAADAKVYKMIGPVLIPQDKTESASNVSKRLEFIKSQIATVEEKLQSLQENLRKTQQKLQTQSGQPSRQQAA